MSYEEQVSQRLEQLAEAEAKDLFESIWGKRYDWNDHHRQDTPRRFIQMMREMTAREDFNFTTFPNENPTNEMVIVKDIDFNSVCAHHLVPFMGRAHVAYIPTEKLVGLSKLARTVRWHAADLTVQEDLTNAIAQFLNDNLEPMGVAVQMEAEHLCMTVRGVKAPGAKTVTNCMMGAFADHSKQARSEFLSSIRHP